MSDSFRVEPRFFRPVRLPYSIAITLGMITCLSSLMLGLGQGDLMLPVLMFIAAVTSFFLTDVRRIIRLGDWTVNVLVLTIVFFAMGDLVRTRYEDFAFAIARVLVFVEMVLLFREKEARFCWQILLISLLQVVVATVMPQELFFAFLLLLYVFVGLVAFVLIFLQRENRYFRNHSFVGTFFDSLKSEIAARRDHGKLARLALVTLLTGPLSVVFSFNSSQEDKEKIRPTGDGDPKSSPREILRSLFAVFPKEPESTTSEHWETISDQNKTESVPQHWYDVLWDKPGVQDPTSPAAGEPGDDMNTKRLVPVPVTRTERRNRDAVASKTEKSRFPLLDERPEFSAGTMRSNGLEGGRNELFRHLVGGTCFAMIFAALLFCFIPRIGKIEFWQYTFKFGHENWSRPFVKPVGTVGFSEEIRLGSLGTVIPYHREVMTARFYDCPDRRLPRNRRDTSREIPYNEIQGASLYFFGISLEEYSEGTWKSSFPRRSRRFYQRFSGEEEPPPPPLGLRDRPMEQRSIADPRVPGRNYGLRPGGKVHPDQSDRLFFESGTDLVTVDFVIQPLDTKVFFAPRPFFFHIDNQFVLRHDPGRSEELQFRNQEIRHKIYTTAFRKGSQLALIPCRERISEETLLQKPDQGLEALAALAEKWDDESGLPGKDVAGRALFMEQKFLTSDQFSYKLGGTVRDYDLDPLEDFVNNNPTGHCEYFAGALSLMLRSVGICSRVVVGFKATSVGNVCTVRQSDAHAWVEVYLPPEAVANRQEGPYADWWENGAWLRLDPTPASGDPSLIDSVSFSLADLSKWIQTMWGEFVLNMNSSKQTEWIYEPIQDGAKNLLIRLFDSRFWRQAIPGIYNYYRNLFSGGNKAVWHWMDWLFLALPLFLALALCFLLRRLYLMFKPYWQRSSADRKHQRATIDFFIRMERLLARAGCHRPGTQTPRQFTQQTEFALLTSSVVDAYYKVRFGAEELTAEELRNVLDDLNLLEKEILKHESA